MPIPLDEYPVRQLPLDAVRVTRTYRTGAPFRSAVVNCPAPWPEATAVVQFTPSVLVVIRIHV